jgi:hypothetical protein
MLIRKGRSATLLSELIFCYLVLIFINFTNQILIVMKLKTILIITAPVALLFASCLKKHNSKDVIDDNGSIVTVIQEVGMTGGQFIVATEATPPTETVGLLTLKTYATRDVKPGGNVHVKLTYVTPAGYDALPANGYTLASEFDVPKETGTLVVPITLNKVNLDLSKSYAIQATISTVSEGAIGANDKTLIIAFVIKNAYDGNYSVTGFFFHPSSPRPIALTKALATVGAVRSLAPLGDLGSSNYYFQFDVSGTSATNWTAYGACPVQPSSGFFTADNPGGIVYPGPEYPGTAPYVQTTYNNSYNAATKTFWLHYGYGSGSTGPTGWSRNVYEKWVKQ